MGSEVSAKCECGFEATIPFGGGMRNFATTCYFPCLCEACHNMVVMNLLAADQLCPTCKSAAIVPYDDPRLSNSPGQVMVAGWNLQKQLGRQVKLNNGNYHCPKCRQTSLHFRDTGLRWD